MPQAKVREKGVRAGLKESSDTPSSEKRGAHVGDGVADAVEDTDDTVDETDGETVFDVRGRHLEAAAKPDKSKGRKRVAFIATNQRKPQRVTGMGVGGWCGKVQ